MTTLSFAKKPVTQSIASHIVIGNKSLLGKDRLSTLDLHQEVNVFKHVANGTVEDATQWIETGDETLRVTFANLSDKISRNLGTIRSDLIPDLVKKHTPKEGDALITLVLNKKEQVFPAGVALARAFPIFNESSAAKKLKARTVTVAFSVAEEVSEEDYAAVQRTADAVRYAALLVDKPTNYLNTDDYHTEIKELAARYPSVKLTVFRDKDLLKEGLNNIYAVGKAAAFPPLMAVLEYEPENPVSDFHLALLGKGIVYDSGGLSLKSTANMCTMKGDMGGSAACLAGFESLVKAKYQGKLSACLAIAENMIGPLAYKNDDIITGYSGKSIQINNTDAEGRIVLSDAIAWVTKNLKPTHAMELCTLTGASLVACGNKHAAILANDEEFQNIVQKSGQISGDWAYPILYAPELHMAEFETPLADMKNSVKDRMNAQSSCAGAFCEAHINEDWHGLWSHIDMAGPSFAKDRGTGYGVALVVQVANDLLASPGTGRGQ